MRKSIIAIGLALSLISTQANAGGYRDRDAGAAIAAGVLGIVAGALINNRGCGRCYGPGPYEYGPYQYNPYNSYPPAYYGPPRGYPGYPGPYLGPYPRYGYGPGPDYYGHEARREWRRDRRPY